MTENKKTVKEFISEVEKKSQMVRKHIYRGSNKEFSKNKDGSDNEDGICSCLYRLVKEQKLNADKFDPIDFENQIAINAKQHFLQSNVKMEILTEMQHFGGKTNLIDFSSNLYVALFFACYEAGKKQKNVDGELILLESLEKYKKELTENPQAIKITDPVTTQNSKGRVNSQHSVFVCPTKGYIQLELCKRIPVPKDLKKDILIWLEKYHNINKNTVFNDLIGFIQDKENFDILTVYFYKGYEKQGQYKHKEAIGFFDTVIGLKKKFGAAYDNRGFSNNKLGHYHEAIKDLNKATAINQDDVIAYYNRGISLSKLGLWDEAIIDFDKALKRHPNYCSVLIDRGYANIELKQYNAAIVDSNAALKNDPNSLAFFNLRKAQEEINKLHDEITLNKAKIEKDRKNSSALYNLGYTYFALEKFDEAIIAYTNFIRLNPKHSSAFYERGNAKLASKKYKNAIDDYTKAIDLDDNNAKAFYARGNAKSASKNYKNELKSAIDDYTKAINLDDHNAESFYKRGNAKLASKKYEEAIKDYRKAIKIKKYHAKASENIKIAKSKVKVKRKKLIKQRA